MAVDLLQLNNDGHIEFIADEHLILTKEAYGLRSFSNNPTGPNKNLKNLDLVVASAAAVIIFVNMHIIFH